MTGRKAFWRDKRLEELSAEEWEALCDGCGRCCLNKLEDFDTGEISWTNIACRLYDETECRCLDYANRAREMPDCVPLTPQNVREIDWLPPSCAYRLVAEGRDLYWWHHLLSGSRQTVHEAGISTRGRTVSECDVEVTDWEDFLVDWPTAEPAE
ncbi:YcgN family cysteine cluster protein [Afifella pfennigii]|uniref:YcgN family cysteine cluster protein n=1 Tax=Afifella pfennigii TaxID=209897 RepID=UPI00054D40B7|nr:YcgN family cysteine cluster protein [Afifella pfennigii]